MEVDLDRLPTESISLVDQQTSGSDQIVGRSETSREKKGVSNQRDRMGIANRASVSRLDSS